jgi:hypothetical protein
MIVIVILTFAAAGVLSYSLNTYRNSIRQVTMDQAKIVADGEMENLYYVWKSQLILKQPVANIQHTAAVTALTSAPSQPFVSSLDNLTPQWTVSRTLAYAPVAGTTGDGSATGVVPYTTEIGHNYYFTATTTASITKPLLGTISYGSGRHFVYSSTSVFQFAVFYQGDLEMAAGSDMTINGPISTNSSAYLAAGAPTGAPPPPPFVLTLTDAVYYFQNYNGAPDPLTGETDWLEGNNALTDPIYNPGWTPTDPDAPPPTDQAGQRAIQVQKLLGQSNFVGGVDVAADVANPTYAAAYSNLLGVVDPNEIYRAVIAPPPVDSGGVLLPEDPLVAGSRMYNSAGILITITQNAPGTPSAGNTTIHVGTAANPTLYDGEPAFATIVSPNTNTDPVTTYPTSIIQGVRSTMVDPREYLNGTTSINLTTLDIGNLNTALATAMASNPSLQANYNGVVYIYDNTNNATNSPANSQNGIRLTNATTTPAYNDQNGNPIGFSVVSNNGVYVQGDYNSTPIVVGGVSVTNPAAILGDAVTALSQGWSLTSNSGLQIWSDREATASGPTLANGVNPISSGTPGGMTVNAAILTGNTPTISGGSAPNNSGGAQNLVRMIEDWYYPNPTGATNTDGSPVGMNLTLNGSLGQLFISKYFDGEYKSGMQQALGTISPGVYDRVYIQPKTRKLIYDTNFKVRSPAGSPSTPSYNRGPYFYP